MANYEDEAQIDMIRKKAIEEMQIWLEKMPMDERKKVALYLGTRKFTPEELLKEMVENGEYGNTIAQMINNHGNELAKIEKEKR